MTYDAAIVGAGPVGCAAALAFAARGARVLLCEAEPRACRRLAGEWLHPPAVAILEDMGVGDVGVAQRGFVVLPDDRSDPIKLPYATGAGAAIEHARLVDRLRARVKETRGVEYLDHARVTSIDAGRVIFEHGGAKKTMPANLVVDASGRSTIGSQGDKSVACSRMAGLVLTGVELPREGFGHVMLGGPGVVLAYRIDADRIRLCLDVPLDCDFTARARLWDAFGEVFPPPLRRAFRCALEDGEVVWAKNQLRLRRGYGKEGIAAVGDAVGHHHPLTAVGLTLGFQDALAVASSPSVVDYARRRRRECRVPEALAVSLYGVFTDPSDDAAVLRRAVYDVWRGSETERKRTMAYLGCQDDRAVRYGVSFARVATIAARLTLGRAAESGHLGHQAGVAAAALRRCAESLQIATGRMNGRRSAHDVRLGGRRPEPPTDGTPRNARVAFRGRAPHIALERGVGALARRQRGDGSWEGECVWNPMLAAQYVIACRLTKTTIATERARRLVLHFERTQLVDGTWGMHAASGSSLFVTTLAYVAARLLEVPPGAPLLSRARAFIVREGITRVPTWGKFWLALLRLYEWRGINPVLPELWALPPSLPLYPSNYYCHTRLIYLGMAALWRESFEPLDLAASLRQELYPEGYEKAGFRRGQLRAADAPFPPRWPLRFAFSALSVVDRAHRPALRAKIRRQLLDHLRFEAESTDCAFLSPVSGLLGVLALYKSGGAWREALQGIDAWFWEDNINGARVAGARSTTWDTAFAVQALTAASAHADVIRSLDRGDAYLEAAQITAPWSQSYERFFRIDPRGGFCFAPRSHGWPVSDCTAEALIARLGNPVARPSAESTLLAVQFILRTQCRDGGFGSYEPARTRIPLEWLNPAEMFGDSMTERSYVECTASCIAALAAAELKDDEVDRAIARGMRFLRRAQRTDGLWSGAWGVHFVYGTMFGVRGLLATGAPPFDPQIRKACSALRARQRTDGGWSEHHEACIADRWIDGPTSQVVQTAWALTTLLEARDPDDAAIDRAAAWLASRQESDGTWADDAPAGVFFRTALIGYDLYRSYFPILALALHETRRLERLSLTEARRARSLDAPEAQS
jgi:lanosterol synthase